MSGQPEVIRNLIRIYPQLSEGQQKVAAYIIHHNDHAAFMTLTELAEAVGVSKSTVERVARQTLQYDSFYDFRNELQKALRATFEPADKIRASLTQTKTVADIASLTLLEDIANLEHTQSLVDADAFESVVQLLGSARRVFLYGRGVSKAVAIVIYERLSLLRPDVYAVEDGIGSTKRRLLWLEPDDLIIFISFPTYAQETIVDAEYAAARGAHTVAITDRVTSPLVEHTREHLLLHTQRDSAMVSSLVPAMSLADALVTALIQISPESSERMRSLSERDISYLNTGNARFVRAVKKEVPDDDRGTTMN